MRIRATFPFSCYITGPTAAALSPEFRFTSRQCVVLRVLRGAQPLALPNPSGEDPWFRKVDSLIVEIDEASTDLVTRVIASAEDEKIIGCLLKPANRIIRSIRNFGLVTHVREHRSSEFSADRWLDLLSVEASADGTTWQRLREPPDDLAELLAGRSMLRRDYVGRFKSTDLAEVQEAIEDNLAAGPEKAFLANALEYLRTGDLRVAVVEIIICLEILISQLLPELLAAKSVAADTLTKEITLFPRVKMLLPLLMAREVAGVDLAAVLQTISWRNKIVHQSGNLPEGIPDGNVRQGIAAVVTLVYTLAHKRDSLKRAPNLQRLSRHIASHFSIREPTIEWLSRHSYAVRFPFMFDPMPPMERLAEISQAVVDGLRQLDSRCQADADIFIYFSQFGTEVATWQRGEFIVIPGQPPSFPGIGEPN